MTGLLATFGFVAGMIALNRFLASRDRQGHWDKEGHGTNHARAGLKYRPLEVPPSPPFD